MDTHFETLSALLDGEPVKIAELEAALEDPEGQRALVDFVRLRQTARAEAAMPRGDFSDRVRRSFARRRRFSRLRVPLPLAAAAVVLALLGGALLDVKRPAPAREQIAATRPPPPSRVLQFDPPPPDMNAGGR